MSDLLDKFNKIIMNLRNIENELDEEDQVLVLLCSLPVLFDNFVNSMLFGRYTIFLVVVKSV